MLSFLLEGVLVWFSDADPHSPRWRRWLAVGIWTITLVFLVWMIVLFGFLK